MGFLPKKGIGSYIQHNKPPKERPKENYDRKPYDKASWRKYSIIYRKKHPFCSKCSKFADHVDHIVPISEGGSIWNPENHQSLCISCHGKKTRKEQNKK